MVVTVGIVSVNVNDSLVFFIISDDWGLFGFIDIWDDGTSFIMGEDNDGTVVDDTVIGNSTILNKSIGLFVSWILWSVVGADDEETDPVEDVYEFWTIKRKQEQ